MIHANPPSDIFISISHACDGAVNKLPRLLFVTTLTITLMVVPAVAQTPSFHGLGEMPGVWPAAGTYASGISGDGSTIMGYGWVCPNGGTSCTSSDRVKAYRWTVAGKYQILGSSGSSDFFGAGAVSNDGSVIVGEHALPNKFDAFRWTATHGMVRLPMNIANAVTADGAMVAGGDNWWKTSGQTGIFGPFPAVGAAIKGSGQFGPTFQGEQDQTSAFGLSGTSHAFRWTPVSGLQDLGLTAGTESFAPVGLSTTFDG